MGGPYTWREDDYKRDHISCAYLADVVPFDIQGVGRAGAPDTGAVAPASYEVVAVSASRSGIPEVSCDKAMDSVGSRAPVGACPPGLVVDGGGGGEGEACRFW